MGVVELQVFVLLDAAPASCAHFAQDMGGQLGTLDTNVSPFSCLDRHMGQGGLGKVFNLSRSLIGAVECFISRDERGGRGWQECGGKGARSELCRRMRICNT